MRIEEMLLTQQANGDELLSLSRYELTIERSFYKALHELQRLQGMRLGQPVVMPIAIDVDEGLKGPEVRFV